MIGFFKNDDSKLKSENELLNIENELLKNKIEEQDKLLFDLKQENSIMDSHIKELEEDLEEYYKIQDKEQEKLEEYLLRGKDKYSNTLDNVTMQRDTYKKVINIMCDKFNINHDSVLNIIDDLSKDKSKGIERV